MFTERPRLTLDLILVPNDQSSDRVTSLVSPVLRTHMIDVMCICTYLLVLRGRETRDVAFHMLRLRVFGRLAPRRGDAINTRESQCSATDTACALTMMYDR